jgi:hypothetical protein
MHRTVAHIIVGLTVMTSWVACGKCKPDPGSHKPDDSAIVVPMLDPPNTGTIGHNGLFPQEVFDHINDMKTVMDGRLTLAPPDAGELSATFDGILNPPDAALRSKTLADYLISCAVPNTTVTSYKNSPYDAGAAYVSSDANSLLQNVDGWRNGGLSMAAQSKNDLYTCLATRLNPYGANVKIWLGGQNVTKDAPVTNFPYPEAYWVTTLDSDYKPTIYVWPVLVKSLCDPSTPSQGVSTGIPALNTRVCGTGSGAAGCKLEPGPGSCSAVGSGYSCQDPSGGGGTVSAIATKLDCTAWCALYPSCRVPDHCSCAGAPRDAGPSL